MNVILYVLCIVTCQGVEEVVELKYVLLLGSLFVLLAVLIGLQQFMRIGQFFQLKDALHHEFFMALFGAFGLGLIVGALLERMI